MSKAPIIALDANAFDRLVPGDGLAETLLRLVEARRLRIGVLAGVVAEVSRPDAPPEVRAALLDVLRAAAPLPRSRPTARQEIDRIRVRAILRGDGRPGKHDADAAHLSEAAEAGCSVFVTADGKILRKREPLALALPAGLRILTLAELVAAFASDEDDPREAASTQA